ETEFLALELPGAGDAETGAVGVERRALMRVLAIAKRLGESHVDAESARKRAGVEGRLSFWFGSLSDCFKGAGNGCIVSRRKGKRFLGQSPTSFSRESPARAVHFLDQSGIVRDARHDGHVFEVFGGGTHHGRAANIDFFNEMA